MTLMERINEVQEPYVETDLDPWCLYCGRDDCGHARGWQSRAWSSECAAMSEVLPSLLPSLLPSYEGFATTMPRSVMRSAHR